MADYTSIPRTYLKELTDSLSQESLKVALFVNITGYDELAATNTITTLRATATEVSHASYTTGGYVLNTTSSNMATNGAMLTATSTTVAAAEFTYRYSVIYSSSTGKIRFVIDHLLDKTITGGTLTIAWNATEGVINFSF